MNKTKVWAFSVVVIIIVISIAAYFIVTSSPKIGKYAVFEDKIYGKTMVLDTETGRSWSYDGEKWVELPRFIGDETQKSDEIEQKAMVEQQLNELKAKQEEELNSMKIKYEKAENELKTKMTDKSSEQPAIKSNRPATAKKYVKRTSYPKKKRAVTQDEEQSGGEAPEWLNSPGGK